MKGFGEEKIRERKEERRREGEDEEEEEEGRGRGGVRWLAWGFLQQPGEEQREREKREMVEKEKGAAELEVCGRGMPVCGILA